MSSRKSDDRKIWKLMMLAETSKTVLEEKDRTLFDIPTRESYQVKRKVASSSSSSRPEWLVKEMRKVNGYNQKLIIAKKKLYQSDLNQAQSRLSIPINQVVNLDFLPEEETRINMSYTSTQSVLYEQSVLTIHPEGMSFDLFDPLLNKHDVDLRKWKIGGNWSYVIVDGWNGFVDKNTFDVDDVIDIWSFRCGRGKLCFDLSPPVRDSR